MKIEIGESLMYSWMRHVKDCKIVQTNWKVSGLWGCAHMDKVEKYMKEISELLKEKMGFDVFKMNASSKQVITQGECDVIGVNLSKTENAIYAADIAFHRNGLNYANTVQKVIEKCVRTAFCVYLYTNMKDAEIIFASPKIGLNNMTKIKNGISTVQATFDKWGFNYKFDVIANQDFFNKILQPVCAVSSIVDDTGELYLRSHQLDEMFFNMVSSFATTKPIRTIKASSPSTKSPAKHTSSMSAIKIGKLAQIGFGKLASMGSISAVDVTNLLDAGYSKTELGLNYPCLVVDGSKYDECRYYVYTIEINKVKYHLCSQWFETSANNDRPQLEKWLNDRHFV